MDRRGGGRLRPWWFLIPLLISNSILLAPHLQQYAPNHTQNKSKQQHHFVSPVCHPSFGAKQNITRIYHAHTRKAGGTSIFRLLKTVANAWNWTYVHREGTIMEPPTRQDTLYVTHMREPVSRIISDYQYEARWDCKEMIRNKSAVFSYDNEKSFEQDIQDIVDKKRPLWGSNPNKLWRCVEQCYLRWYGKDFNFMSKGTKHNVTENYRTALDFFNKYDIIVVMERLKDPEYVKGLESMFGDMAKGVLSTRQIAYCFPESRKWNSLYPASIRNETVDRLQKLNEYDIQLYNEVNHCPFGVHFPDPTEHLQYLPKSKARPPPLQP